MNLPDSMLLIFEYKLRSFINRIKNLKGWRLIKVLIFLSVSIFLLILLYLSFLRILNYLKGVELIGMLLISKLSAIVFVITFSMIVVSSLIISMTTLFYSGDLNFLFSLPLSPEKIFVDKLFTTVFYSSWSLIVVIIPYILALMKINNPGSGFFLAFLFLIIPYAFLACMVGIISSLLIMYFFPNSKTRDVIWIISSLSFSLVYIALRFSKPEKLLRPDMLGVIANYLSYLQAPTASYLPSWWFTKALFSFLNHNYQLFFINFLLLYSVSLTLFFFVFFLSKFIYLDAFNGAGAKSQRKYIYKEPRWFKTKSEDLIYLTLLFYKEKRSFLRDARYFSQLILIVALSMVYLFSIKNIGIDDYEIRNFISFLNIIAVGFVISAISLRFIFTSISSEDGNWWIIKSSPVKIEIFLLSKLIFYFVFIYLFALILVSMSNYYLGADRFIFSLSLFIISIMSFVISLMAVSLGAIFPDFNIENIHQVESSYGGFIFMVSSLFYCILTAMIFSYPVREYFFCLYNPNYSFRKDSIFIFIIAFIIISFIPCYFLFLKAKNTLEKFDV